MSPRRHRPPAPPPSQPGPVLITGATGKTGRRVAARLAAQDVPVRPASRIGQPPFDWHDQRTWDAAVDRVDAAYLAYSPDLAVPGAAETVAAFAAAAARAGARRLVLLSGRGEPEALAAEQAVRAAAAEHGASCTVVRASWFAQNFSEDYLLDAVLSGVLALPVGDVPEPFIDADDIADVAAAALTAPGHEGKTYEVTGPRLLTFADAAAEIGAAAGREIRFEPVTARQYADELARHGVPPEAVQLLGYLFDEVLDGRNARVTDGVQQALVRPPRDFADYARDATAAGVWTPPVRAGAR